MGSCTTWHPRLDVYEHVIYAYVLRHTILNDLEDAVIPFKLARGRMSKGAGQRGSPMSEATCREKLQSLVSKGAIEIIRTEHRGTRVRLVQPSDIPGLIPFPSAANETSLEDMDFYEAEEYRLAILEREERRPR